MDPLSWCDALEAEAAHLQNQAKPAPKGPPRTEQEQADYGNRIRAAYNAAHRRKFSALSLSGGGIRSATFALGVLQGLAHAGVLKHFDYLSTVSGGGYTGSWFTSWLHREGAQGRDAVMRELDPATAEQIGDPNDDSPVERMRRMCRYLAPRGGLVSADVWTLLLTMVRNLVLNWFVILPLLAAALLVPRIYYGVAHAIEVNDAAENVCTVADLGATATPFLIVSLLCWVIGTAYVVLNFVSLGGKWSQGRFLTFCLLPAVLAAFSFTLFWSASPCGFDPRQTLFTAAMVPALGLLIAGGVRRGPAGIAASLAGIAVPLYVLFLAAGETKPELRNPVRDAATLAFVLFFAYVTDRWWPVEPARDGRALSVKVDARTVLAAMVGGLILGFATYWTMTFEYGFGESIRQSYPAFAVPALLLFTVAAIIAFAGIAATALDDAVLEWLSRATGWFVIAAAIWAAAGILVFYVAGSIEMGLRWLTTTLTIDHTRTSAILGALVPLLSSLAGLAARGAGGGGRPSALAVVLQRVALPIVIFVLLSSIAWADLRLVEALEYHEDKGRPCSAIGVDENGDVDEGGCHPEGAGLGEAVQLLVVFLALGLLMSRLVPVNRFSLHGMYRQRLIRTFLGASRRDRKPNGFTGFDSNDDLCVHDLSDIRPLHIINTTLNAVQSTSVGRHETMAQSMTFSPLHVGNRFVGYRPAEAYGSDGLGKSSGISLGMAIAVSGAAASSAMGIFSSKSRAFLLTLANARLGLWFGNPSSASSWKSSEPPLGVGPIARELLGLTTDHNPYVYLSDGGHYENLALYEMVARRCRFIVVSDAGCDPNYTFDDLANAVRRCRLDLGIPIEFKPINWSREGQGKTNLHAAIGTVRYGVVDEGAPDGTILYLKATMSGDEAVDIRNFATLDPTFPHDTTSNQFFDEARFESYRALGFHTVLTLTGKHRNIGSVEELFNIARPAAGLDVPDAILPG